MRAQTLIALASALPLLLGATSASAHFTLVSPPTPAGSVAGKGNPPCGPDVADGVVTTVKGGAPLMISIDETTRHGGFYRVALALKSCKKDVMGMPKCFPDDNKVYDKNGMVLMPSSTGDSDHADIDPAPKLPILADGLFPHTQAADGTGPTYMGTTQVALPNINCDRCTLQVIEFMAPHGSNGAAGFFYHHCADLKITADPTKPIDGMGGAGAGGTGGTGSAGAAGSGAAGGSAAGMSNGGTGSGGAPSVEGGSPTVGGAPSNTAGTPTTSAGTTTSPAVAGTGTGTVSGGTGTVTSPGGGDTEDSSGCGIAGRARGGSSALAALGVLLTLVRRRRSR